MSTHSSPRLCATLTIAALILALSTQALSWDRADAQQTNCRRFDETGKSLCEPFLSYWDSHGGLAQQGLPLTGQFSEVSLTDGKSYTVQYFERAVFELHPDKQPPYNVLLSLLGSTRLKEKYPRGAPELPPPMNPVAGKGMLFPETGKEISGAFLDYWKAHGGLMQQGYPITNQFVEKSDLDGKEYTVQYFERAVFEMHPENKAPYNILLSQLGTLQLKKRYPDGVPGDATNTPPADAYTALRQRPLNLPAISSGSPCPVTPGKEVSPNYGIALGNGPVYPVGLGANATAYFGGAQQDGGWYYVKVLWIGNRSYSGPVLVRGREIDKPNELGFGLGSAVQPPTRLKELQLDTIANDASSAIWNEWPSYTVVRAAGCYAYQVDGTNFTETIVFKAVADSPPVTP